VIQEREVSRHHAVIDRVEGHFLIEDLNSSNGVLLNGMPRKKATLKSGDVITLGLVTLIFSLQDESSIDTGEHPMPGARHDNNVVAFVETQVIPEELSPAKGAGALKKRE
jgi:pSer/pThr/pTyr-binding forkhead associated (FHA) protein